MPCVSTSPSRAELFEIISATEIRTFSGLLERFGREKAATSANPPSRRSWLARKGQHARRRQATLQDTNDRFLANIQRTAATRSCPGSPAVRSRRKS